MPKFLHRSRCLAWAQVALAACSQTTITEVDVAESGLEYGVMVALGPDAQPRRISAVFGIEQKVVSHGELPAFELQEDEVSAVVVGFDRTAAFEVHPGFQPDRAKEIEVRLAAPPDVAQSTAPGNYDLIDAPLPSRAIVLPKTAIDDSGRQALRSRLTLQLPIDIEYCRQRDNNATTWSSQIPPPPSGNTVDPFKSGRRVQRMEVLDTRRTIVATDLILYVVEDGVEPSIPRLGDTPRSKSTRMPGAGSIDGMAVGPDEGSGVRRVLLVGADDGKGTVWTVEFDGEAFGPVQTTTITEAEADTRWRAAAIGADGHQVIVGSEAAMFVRRAGEDRFQPARGPEVELDFDAVLVTDDPERPHLLVANGGRLSSLLFHGNGFTGVWNKVAQTTGVTFKQLAKGAANELWAVGDSGLVQRYVDGAWTETSVCLPPRLASCLLRADETMLCLRPADLDGVALESGHAYLLLENCSAIAQVRLSDLCTTSILRGDEIIDTTEVENRAITSGRGRVVVATGDGSFYRFGPR